MSRALSALDRALARAGQSVTLQRVTGGTTVVQAIGMLAHVRGYAPQELVNGITQTDSKVILSPTNLASFNSGAAAGLDIRVPIKGNRIVIAGRTRNVEAAIGMYEGAELVRIECRVLG
jgi:hypothetical protein